MESKYELNIVKNNLEVESKLQKRDRGNDLLPWFARTTQVYGIANISKSF